MDAGAQPQDVFCRGNVTATATGSTNDLPTSAQATIVAGPTGGGGGGSSGDSGDGIDGVDSGSDESSGSDSNDASTTSMKANMGYAALTFAAIVTLAVPFWVG